VLLSQAARGLSLPARAALSSSLVVHSRRLLSGESRFALVAPLVALATYLPTVVVSYAFMDDYFVLAWREGLGGEFYKTATQFGRPLHALVLSGTFALASDVDSLRFVRLVSLLGLIALTLLLYHALRQAALGRWVSMGACVSVVTLASSQVYVSWAAIGEAPFVATLGGLAFLRLRSGFDLRGRAAVVRGVEAAALLLCALLIYQPAAMFFWVFAAIDLLRPPQRLRLAWLKFGQSLAVAAVASLFAYAAVRIGVHFYGGAFSGRTNLVHDLVSKASWFWNEPIVNSLGMFGLLPTATVAIAVVILIAAGILLLHSDSGSHAFGFLGLAALLVPLSYLPNLAVAEEFASYRSIGALASLLTLYVWLGLSGIWQALRSAPTVMAWIAAVALAALLSFIFLALIILPLWRPEERVSIDTLAGWPQLFAFVVVFVAFAGLALLPQRPAAALGALALAAFLLGGALIAARNVTTLFVRPQSTELQLLRTELDDRRAPQQVVFVKPNWNQGAAPLLRYDEFGLPSTYFPWVPGPAVILVSREQRSALPAIEVLAWDQAPARKNVAGDLVVDMRELRKHRDGWSVWTLRAATADAPAARPR
jgi:hypothetical protein